MYTKNKLSNNFRVRIPDSEGNLSIPTPTKNSACEDDEINDGRLSPPSHDLHTKGSLPSHKESSAGHQTLVPSGLGQPNNTNGTPLIHRENPGNDEAKLSLSGCGVNSDTDGAMPTPKDEDDIKKKNLSPDSQIINRLNSLNTKVAELPTPPQQYGDKFRSPPSHNADDDDMEAIFHLISTLKKCNGRLGVSNICKQFHRGSAKVWLGKDRLYEEGRDFEVRNRFKNGITAVRVCTVRNNMTGNDHVLKEIPLSKFREQEIRAMRTLKETNISPELYLFCLVDNTVQIHMELVNGVLLDDVIFKKINIIYSSYPHLVTPFIKNLFYSLLSAVRRMHDHGWIHGDLHYQNILVGQDLTFSIIDFGEAKARKKEEEKDEIYYLVKGLCINIEEISESFEETELEELLKTFNRIVESKSSNDIQRILENLREQIECIDMEWMLEAVIPVLFPPPPGEFKSIHDSNQIPGSSRGCISDRGTHTAHPGAVQLLTSILPTLKQNTKAMELETKGWRPIAEELAYSLEENQRLEAELQPEKSDPATVLPKQRPLSLEIATKCGGSSMNSTPDGDIPSPPPPFLVQLSKSIEQDINH